MGISLSQFNREPSPSINVDYYLSVINKLKNINKEIKISSDFIIGFPGETEETVEATREFIQNSALDYYFIQPFYYLHHTPIHKRANDFDLTGEGLFWSHATMNWKQAVGHINRLFLEIDGAVFVNPDYTLWEVAYLPIDPGDLGRSYQENAFFLPRRCPKLCFLGSADTKRGRENTKINIFTNDRKKGSF